MTSVLESLNFDISQRTHKVPYFDYYLPETIERGKIKLHIGEEWNPKFKIACVAEFIGMMLFVTLCCGAAMVNLSQPHPNLMLIAMSFGFGIMVLAQFIGPLSGGHINNAVSFGLFVGGRISFIRMVMYTFSHMAGSFTGAMLLLIIVGPNWPGGGHAYGSNGWNEDVFSGGQVFLAEIFGTMLLVYNVFATIDIPTAGGGPLGVFPIAMSVMVAHLFLLPIDGCSINPARSFGPSFLAALSGMKGNFHAQQYMFWFAPLIGATITAIIYEYAPLKPKKRETKEDMSEAIFLSKKKRDGGEISDDDEEDIVKPVEDIHHEEFEDDLEDY